MKDRSKLVNYCYKPHFTCNKMRFMVLGYQFYISSHRVNAYLSPCRTTHDKMPYELEFTDIFVSQFEKLEKEHPKRIYKKIQELKENPYRHKALTGPLKGCFRLRVGNYRVPTCLEKIQGKSF